MKILKMVLLVCIMTTMIMASIAGPIMASDSKPLIDSQDVEEFIDSFMQQHMESLNIPNAAVSVVADGEVILSKGYGYSNLEELTPVDPDQTMFRVGSIAKLFTWTAIMQLVEQGKLDLDTDINEYLDYDIPSKLTFQQGQAEPKPITLKHLMTHTSGFEDYSMELYSFSADELLPLQENVRKYLPKRIFPAGEVIAYSNYGVALAGYIVELVSGMPYADYIEQNIYTPLGMENSTFRQPIPEHLSANMTKAYRYVNGEYLEGRFEYLREPDGSMSSSAGDMAKFMLAYLQGGQYDGNIILEENTVNQMFTQLFSYHPELDGMAYGFIKSTYNDRRTFFHTGSTTLFDNALYLLPEEQVGLFITQSGGSFLVNNELYYAFMDRYFPSEIAAFSLTPDSEMIERSKQFVGEYQQNRRSLTTSDKFLSILSVYINVDIDDEGYLLVTHIGETNRFVEVEHGVYHSLREGRSQDPTGDFRTIIFGTDPYGKTMLMTEGAMSYSKANWYETSAFNLSLFMMSIVFIIGSLIYWGIKAIIQRLRSTKREVTKTAKVAKWLAIIYGTLAFVYIIQFMISGQPHPIYQYPAIAVGDVPQWIYYFAFLPHKMAIIGLIMVIFTVAAWKKSYWRTTGLIHYTMFTGATLTLLWMFSFWKQF